MLNFETRAVCRLGRDGIMQALADVTRRENGMGPTGRVAISTDFADPTDPTSIWMEISVSPHDCFTLEDEDRLPRSSEANAVSFGARSNGRIYITAGDTIIELSEQEANFCQSALSRVIEGRKQGRGMGDFHVIATKVRGVGSTRSSSAR